MRPRLHLTPATGWVNDPYGLTWHDGRYHLFFQHVPGSTSWAPEQHWGHAVSSDLVTWTERPVALSPGDGDDGLWSGCLAGGRIFYTSASDGAGGFGRVRVADPVDESWDEWAKGPVVVTAPPGLGITEFRDPFVLRDAEGWRMVLGAGTGTGVPMVLGWTSPDLATWTYDGMVASGTGGSGIWAGDAWECPQLFEVDGSWVLVVSVWTAEATHHEICAVGDLVDGRFEARRWQRLTHGAHYAGSFFRDRDSRPCLVHWLRDVANLEAGWAGAHSVPHVVDVVDDRVVLSPHPAVASEVTAVGPLRVLVDGPVVEVFTSEGVAGFVVRA